MSIFDKLEDAVTDTPTEQEAQDWLKFANNLAAETRKAEKQAMRAKRHKERIERCGKWSAGEFDIHTGKPKRYVYKCDLWRDGCPRCLQERAEYVRNSFVEVLAQKKLYVVEVSADKAKKLIRKMNKEQYEKFPQEDAELLIFEEGALDLNKLEEVEELTIQNAFQWNWEAVVKLPEGRNKSGSLSTPKAATGEEEFALINNNQIVTDAPGKMQDDLFKEVMQETSNLQPKNAKAVEKALYVRSRLYGKKLKNAGYNVFYHRRKRKCHISRISWTTDTKIMTNSP